MLLNKFKLYAKKNPKEVMNPKSGPLPRPGPTPPGPDQTKVGFFNNYSRLFNIKGEIRRLSATSVSALFSSSSCAFPKPHRCFFFIFLSLYRFLFLEKPVSILLSAYLSLCACHFLYWFGCDYTFYFYFCTFVIFWGIFVEFFWVD